MSTKNTILPGITSAVARGKKEQSGGNGSRMIENEIIARERYASLMKKPGANLDLCAQRVLPEGTHCEKRVERDGLFFCPGKDANCPSSKERA